MSITIPFFIALIPYALFLLVFVIFSFLSLSHLAKYSTNDFVSFAVTFFFLGGVVIVAYLSWQFLSPFGWLKPMNIPLPTLWPQSL